MTGISKITITGVHGYQSIQINLNEGLNLIHGKNGVGKTTLLHIIANALNSDFSRFVHLNFSKISIHSFSGRCLRLESKLVNERTQISVWLDRELRHVAVAGDPPRREFVDELAMHFGSQPVYVPAFRTILEGSFSERGFEQRFEFSGEAFDEIVRHQHTLVTTEEAPNRNALQHQQRIEQNAYKTLFCRRFFGQFIPIIRYQSLGEARLQIEREIREAWFELSSFDQQALANFAINAIEATLASGPAPKETEEDIADVYRNIQELLEAQRTQIPEAFERVKQLLQPNASRETASPLLRPILTFFASTLEGRRSKQSKIFSKLRTFEDSLNRFLENKRVIFVRPEARRGPRLILSNGHPMPLSAMSSGERHVFSLLFSATHIGSGDGIIIIDEPELSLHMDWQRMILAELFRQCDSRQMVVCTHSSEVAADHRAVMVELAPRQWKATSVGNDPEAEESELI